MAERMFGAQQGRRHHRHHHGQVTRRAGATGDMAHCKRRRVPATHDTDRLRRRRDDDVIAVFCLLHYSFLSVTKINVWHRWTTHNWRIRWPVAWHSQVKTRICAEGGHFKLLLAFCLA